MLKTTLLTLLTFTTLFSYEIVIDKTSKNPNTLWGATFTRDDTKEVVINDKTGLMWQDNSAAISVKKDWKGAKEYCRALNFAGYNDWYLPSISELESLVDIKKYNPAINSSFRYVSFSRYWSSSSHVLHYDNYYYDAWYVHFEGGDSDYLIKTSDCYVRCARTGE